MKVKGVLFIFLIYIFSCSGNNKEFGEKIIKIDGQFVDKKIVQEEWKRFYLQNKYNAFVLRMPMEEKYYHLVKRVVERKLIEDILSNEVKVTDVEVSNYVDRYVKTSYYVHMAMEGEYLPENYLDVKVEEEKYLEAKIYLMKLKLFSDLAISKGINVSEDELEKEFVSQKSNILITGRMMILPASKASLIKNIKTKEDFIKICREFSIAPETKERNGFVGDIRSITYFKKVKKNLFEIKEDDVLTAIDGKNFVVFYVEKIVPFYKQNLELKQQLLLKKFINSSAFTNWINDIESKRKIEITHPYFEVYYAYSRGDYKRAGVLYEEIFRKYNSSIDYLFKSIDCFSMAGDWRSVIKVVDRHKSKFTDFKLDFIIVKAKAAYMLNDKGKFHKMLTEAKKIAIGDNSKLEKINKLLKELSLSTDEP